MQIRSNLLFPRPQIAALALAASLLSIGTTAADAQWFRWPSWDAALRPVQVERMIEASGYRLTAPVLRNGPVYLANVLGREDDAERLVIDARDGRLLQRYALASLDRQPAFAGPWSRPGPDGALSGEWRDRGDDFAPPRPPGEIYGDAGVQSPRVYGDAGVQSPYVLPAPQPIQRPHAAPPDQVAHADDAASPSSPYVIMAPNAATQAPTAEKPKPKPHVQRKKPDPTIAQPGPTDGKPAATSPTPASTPAPASNPQAAITPAAPAPTHEDAASQPAVATAPRVAESKIIPAAPEPTPAAPATAPAKPALNDVPVAPLE